MCTWLLITQYKNSFQKYPYYPLCQWPGVKIWRCRAISHVSLKLCLRRTGQNYVGSGGERAWNVQGQKLVCRKSFQTAEVWEGFSFSPNSVRNILNNAADTTINVLSFFSPFNENRGEQNLSKFLSLEGTNSMSVWRSMFYASNLSLIKYNKFWFTVL